MPCDSIITNTIDMPRMDPRLLAATLANVKNADFPAGATHIAVSTDGTATFILRGDRYVLRNGQLTSTSASEATVARAATAIKHSYGHQVVRATARKNGWALRQTGPNTYAAVKR